MINIIIMNIMNISILTSDIKNKILSYANNEICLSKLKKKYNFNNFFYSKLIIDTDIYFTNNKKLIQNIFNNFIELKFIDILINYKIIIKYCKNLTHLNLGNSFNQKLDSSLNNLINLIHLYLGREFNQKSGINIIFDI